MNLCSVNSRLAIGFLAAGSAMTIVIGRGYDDPKIQLPVHLASWLASYSLAILVALLLFSVVTVVGTARDKRHKTSGRKQTNRHQENGTGEKDRIVSEPAGPDLNPLTDSKPIWVRPVPGKNKLLFVDDDRVSRMAMTALLTAEGYEIDDVDSGAEALVKLQFNDYDAVLIDFRMPQMSGLELAAFIHDGYIGAVHLPLLIAITGGLSAQEQKHAEIAFDRIIVKPIKAKALSSMLAKLLAGSDETPQG